MSKLYVTGTKADCDGYELVCRKALGLPVRGVHVGGGRHVTIPAAPPGPGWTTAWDVPREHPETKDLFAVPVCSATVYSKELSEAEKLIAVAIEATSAELDSSWEPQEADEVRA